MAANFRMTSTGPGKARIAITGVEIPAENANVEIAIQRSSDDWYVGSNGSWQNEAGWHRLERDAAQSPAVFMAGPEIVDALVGVAYSDSFIAFAGQDEQTRGVLKISLLPGLVSSVAQQDPSPPPQTPTGGGPILPGPTPKPIPPGPGPKPVDPAPRKRTPLWWALAVGIVLLVLAVVGALWLTSTREDPIHETAQPLDTGTSKPLGSEGTPAAEPPKPSPTDPAATGQSQPQGDKRPEATPPQTQAGDAARGRSEADSHPVQLKDVQQKADTQPPSEPKPVVPGPGVADGKTPAEILAVATALDAPQLRGREYVRWLVEKSPDPATYKVQAERRAKQGDCDAVILLYDQAARSSPEAAAQVARLYDPDGFKPSACIGQPNARNAMEYYELAAEGGVPKVKQRLDEIRTQGQEPLPSRRTWENRQ